jgi:hypothetical protein
MSVAELLATSYSAHAEYRRLANERRPDKRIPLQQAYHARKAAHEADPEHLDPAWSLDQKATHDELMSFYEQQLALQAVRNFALSLDIEGKFDADFKVD